ncbi:MAG: PilZ domain-containing protein [Deltaproteobacteria bacterium]|nr:PilZ domain-containing protein [Deltaproteobacteria bacterium]
MNERLEQRIDAAIGIVLRVNGVTEPCHSRSISRSGLAIATQKKFDIGLVLDLEIVHHGVRLRTKGRVVSQQPGGIGVEFIDTDAKLETAIANLINTLLGISGPSRVEPSAELRVVAWSLVDAGRGVGGLIRGRMHRSRLLDVSVDGAAIAGKSPPELGVEIDVILPNYLAKGSNEQVQCMARVVRHTEHGFAVKFVLPNASFRRVVSEIRRASRRS